MNKFFFTQNQDQYDNKKHQKPTREKTCNRTYQINQKYKYRTEHWKLFISRKAPVKHQQ